MDLADEVFEHGARDLEIGDHAIAHGPDHLDGSGRLAHHFLGDVADGVAVVEDLAGAAFDGDDGGFAFALTERESNFSIYHRGDWRENEAALREALPALYASFRSRTKEERVR